MIRLKKDIKDIHDQFQALGLGSVIVDMPLLRIEAISTHQKDQDEE